MNIRGSLVTEAEKFAAAHDVDSNFPVHQIMLSAGKYIIENIAHANQLNATGDFIIALPIKIQNGTEAPIRLVGMQQKKTNYNYCIRDIMLFFVRHGRSGAHGVCQTGRRGCHGRPYRIDRR